MSHFSEEMMLSEYFQIAPSLSPFCPARSDRQNSQAFCRSALIANHQTPKTAKKSTRPKSSSFGRDRDFCPDLAM